MQPFGSRLCSLLGISGLLLACAGSGDDEASQAAVDPSFLPPAELQRRVESALGAAEEHGVLPLASPSAGANDRYEDIRGERLHADLRALTEFSLQSQRDGHPLWGRTAGSVYERQAAEWVRDRFEELGLEQVTLDAVALEPLWGLRELRLSLVGGSAPGTPAVDLELRSAMAGFGSPSTPPEGLEAPLVYVGLGTAADLRGRDLSGKIALVHGRALGGAHLNTGESALSRIVRAGKAVGVLVIVDQPGNAQVLTRNGPDGPRIPNMTLGFLDGTYLRKAIEQAPAGRPPRVRMLIRAEQQAGLATSSVSALLPGTGDEVIAFQAHLDGYWQAVTDNGGGVATLLGLARHFAARLPQTRQRSLLFIVTGGHENGSVGASHFARTHRALLERTALVIEIEHAASTLVSHTMGGHYQNTSVEAPIGIFVTNQSPLVLKAFREAAESYGVPVNQAHMPFYWGDIIGLMPSGVVASGWIGSNFYYHSSLDSLETVRPRSLERIARATAQVADTLDGYTRAELEAGSTPFETPDAYRDGGHALPSPLRTLLDFTRTLW
ncbi:MAG: M28 family peptidase [Deltaproteobacteria bacterium]|nr:M28 family peptidase [Deltaproteobacteria bacterium]